MVSLAKSLADSGSVDLPGCPMVEWVLVGEGVGPDDGYSS
jgi:hypothetical protein